MNRIDTLFITKKQRILSVYFTAGYPSLDSVEKIILTLESNGADMIEIGIPYSDPLADGPVIQHSGKIALSNGMTLQNLFLQLRNIRSKTEIPLLLMGYINPIIQFGFERFCETAADTGIDGLIIPDLPFNEYKKDFMEIVTKNNLKNILLITPDTPDQRIREIDKICTGFIYMVSSASITGKTIAFNENHLAYFKRISDMKLRNPALAGFGIHNLQTMEQVFSFVQGAIIGTAYIRELQSDSSIEVSTKSFFRSLN
jgi:tryptophan synthase alpha chain